jgi:glyoxylase-like metal-dependent hydrolase (beta-lactamase superfamily II)
MALKRLAAFFAVMAVCASAAAQPAPPLPHLTAPRLYVLDCGTIISHEPERFGLSRQDVPDPDFSDPCFLVMHPKGILLFDTGLTDAQVGKPIYENKMGYEGQLKTVSLKSELARIGVTPAMITYLALSHSHWDHVGNANDYAGSTWLARKAERDVMFGPKVKPELRKSYAALESARTKFIEGDHDVFGDGSVVLLSTPGHTPGHQSLYVKLARTGGVVISGDLYHYTAERTLNRVPPREQSLETPASRKKVEEFLQRTHSQLWIGHAIDWYQGAVKTPGWYD